VVTNYLDARGVRVADAVGTSCSARLAGTVGVPLRRVTPSRRSPGAETALKPRTELPAARHAPNKTSRADVFVAADVISPMLA